VTSDAEAVPDASVTSGAVISVTAATAAADVVFVGPAAVSDGRSGSLDGRPISRRTLSTYA